MPAYEENVVRRFRHGYSVNQIARRDNTTVEAIEGIIRTWMIAYEQGAHSHRSETAKGLAEHDGL